MSRQKKIDTSEIPEMLPEQFARAVVRKGLADVPSKAQLTLRLDRDVLDWFRSQGKGYQTKINALLRAYMVAYEDEYGGSSVRDDAEPYRP